MRWFSVFVGVVGAFVAVVGVVFAAAAWRGRTDARMTTSTTVVAVVVPAAYVLFGAGLLVVALLREAWGAYVSGGAMIARSMVLWLVGRLEGRAARAR